MRFSRRTEGTTASRTVFKKAREDQRASYRKAEFLTLIPGGGVPPSFGYDEKKKILDCKNGDKIRKSFVFIFLISSVDLPSI